LEKAKNAMTAQTVITIIIIGLAAGILSGLVGIGGGILVVPALVFILGYSQHQAQGTSLGVLSLPVVLLGFLKYYYDSKQPNSQPIDLRVIGLIAIGFFAGSYFGSSLALKINQQLLKKIFAIILFYTAFKMLGWDKSIMELFKKSA
jgi:uncharacterized membrane protein YfcA